MFIKKHFVFVILILLLHLLSTSISSYAYLVPDDPNQPELVIDIVKEGKNPPMFWIWDNDLSLVYGSANPDKQMIYLASLTKAYTLNTFLENFKTEIVIKKSTPYNYSKVKIGDTLSYKDAITALLVRSCNTVAENMLDQAPKDFVTSSGLPAFKDGKRYENKDTASNVLMAFTQNENLIEIYQRIYDGKYGPTTYRKWTAHEGLHFRYIKTGFTDLAGKCVFIRTNNYYFLFVGWDKHSELVKDSISMVKMYEKDHSVPDLKSLGEIYIDGTK